MTGVPAVDVDLLYRGSVRLIAGTPGRRSRRDVDAAGQPVASELLAIADAPFDWLQEMPS